MSSATRREDAGFCPVIMRPALTAKGDQSATARAYLAPFCACEQTELATSLRLLSTPTSLVL